MFARFRDRIQVEHTVPPVEPSRELLDLRQRHAHARDVVRRAWVAQSLLDPDDRDEQVMELCEDVRLALGEGGRS